MSNFRSDFKAQPSMLHRKPHRILTSKPLIKLHTVRGHTLVELLVATALASVAISACLAVFDAARLRGERVIDDARIRKAGRAALDSLKSYGRLAGYGRHLLTQQKRAGQLPIQACGKHSGARRRAQCADAAPRTDTVAIHYRADRASAWRTLGKVPSDCEGHSVKPAKDKPMIAARFIVREDKKRPGHLQLHCSRHETIAGEPLVENIEHLRLRYWVSGANEARTANLIADAEWPHVSGFEACVIVRGERRGGAEPYRDCDNRLQVAAPDGYRRKAYTTTVAIRNADIGDGGSHG